MFPIGRQSRSPPLPIAAARDALCLDRRAGFFAGIDHRERYAGDSGLGFQAAHQLGLPACVPAGELACAGIRWSVPGT